VPQKQWPSKIVTNVAVRSYSAKDLEAAIMDWPIRAGGSLIVHTALHTLGKPSGFAPADLPRILLELLRAKTGANGTIVVPTFNFGFCRGIPYDIRNTPVEGMGAFSEFVRKHQDAVRSHHAMQSVSALGPNAAAFLKADPECAYADEGPFAELLELDATVLLIGPDFSAASLIHRAEFVAGVPYRFIKKFEGTYVDLNGLSSTRTYTMHARMKSPEPVLDLSHVDKWLKNDSTYARRPLFSGSVRMCSARSLFNCIKVRLRNEPLSLLGNEWP